MMSKADRVLTPTSTRGHSQTSRRTTRSPSTFLVVFVLLSFIFGCVGGSDSPAGGWMAGGKTDPEFGEAIRNVTVTAGREAILSCVVDNLGDFRVGWLKVDSQTILTIQKRVVTHNSRVAVTHDEHRTWNLHIRNVKEKDRGCYMCQINTPIMKNQVGCIEVHVSPDIIYGQTSSDTTVNEGESVSLQCTAEGYPKPSVTWKREDGRQIILKEELGNRNKEKVLEVHGNTLALSSVGRHQMGAYLCIASNGVPPTVSKRITLNINFAPMVHVENQLLGAPLHTNVAVECQVEAFPHAITYWQRDTSEMLLQGKKYKLNEVRRLYNASLRLEIQDFNWTDAGQYTCVATNSLGRSDNSIRLYVIDVPPPKATTRDSHRSPTSSPTNAVGSLDLRKREEFKQSTTGTFNSLEGSFDQHQRQQLYGPAGAEFEVGDNGGVMQGGGMKSGGGQGGRGGGGLLADIMGFGGGSSPTFGGGGSLSVGVRVAISAGLFVLTRLHMESFYCVNIQFL